VVLRGGVHYLKDTLHLGPQHSNLTLVAFPGEEAPVVSGGKELSSLQWKPYKVTPAARGWTVLNATNAVSGPCAACDLAGKTDDWQQCEVCSPPP
jgi:hypothetical protein